jgi:hypothetical protein
MKYAIEMYSVVMIYIPPSSFIRIVPDNQKLMEMGYTDRLEIVQTYFRQIGYNWHI